MERIKRQDLIDLVNPSDGIDERTLNAFCASAHIFIEANTTDSGYSEDILTQMELYMAAHLLAMRDPSLRIESQEATRYQGKTGTGLSATLYGQYVLVLDKNKVISNDNTAAKDPQMETLA